jgi:hypothetical protein
MDHSCSQFYSPWADLLSKFHTASESIQALWIVAASVTALGVTYLVMRGVRETVALSREVALSRGLANRMDGPSTARM